MLSVTVFGDQFSMIIVLFFIMAVTIVLLHIWWHFTDVDIPLAKCGRIVFILVLVTVFEVNAFNVTLMYPFSEICIFEYVDSSIDEYLFGIFGIVIIFYAIGLSMKK